MQTSIAMPHDLTPLTLEVVQLGKEYRLYDSPRQRLKALVTGRDIHRSHWALRDVSFALHRGQCLGVIGDNGAGKSSLLKLLAGTLQPSTGTVRRSGRVTAILELGAGFHPDFTGRQNLYFGGSLIGISAAEMARLEPEIIAFSELGEAMDRPVKTYSSGMTVRLAFALVTAVEPQLLIIDEALAVGDQHFQKKCVERIESFRNNGCTILFCSHSLYHVQQLCDTTLWLKGARCRPTAPRPKCWPPTACMCAPRRALPPHHFPPASQRQHRRKRCRPWRWPRLNPWCCPTYGLPLAAPHRAWIHRICA